MADTKEPTRAELAEALIRANATLEEQGKLIAEMRASQSVVGQGRNVSQHFNGPEIRKTPYDGYVQATDRCVINMAMMNEKREVEIHPIVYEKGNTFQVDVDQLWTDDPFLPVIMKGTDDLGNMVVVPNEAALKTRADFRFRRHASVTEDPTLKRASEY